MLVQPRWFRLYQQTTEKYWLVTHDEHLCAPQIYIPDLFATSQTWWKWLHSHDGPASMTFKRQFLNKPDHNSNEKLLSVHCTFIPFLRKIKHDKHSYADIFRRLLSLQRGLLKRNTINESSVSCQKDCDAWTDQTSTTWHIRTVKLNCSSFPCWRLNLALLTLTILYIPSLSLMVHPSPRPQMWDYKQNWLHLHSQWL